MRTTILLYTTDAPALCAATVESCMEVIAPASKFQVSRTIGPENYYEINKRLMDDDDPGPVPMPEEDIHRKPYSKIKGVGKLFRPNSVLKIHYSFSSSQCIEDLTKSIAEEHDARFFSSGAWLRFGPSDITAQIETEEGDPDLTLVDVSRFQFGLTCDHYTGNPISLQDNIGRVSSFAALRESFGRIVGPMKVHVSY